jgi:hypothetical protein
MVDGLWLMVYGVWVMVDGCMVYGLWCMVCGVWFPGVLSGRWQQFVYPLCNTSQRKAKLFVVSCLEVLLLQRIIKTRNFAKRQCKLQWLTPPNKSNHIPRSL